MNKVSRYFSIAALAIAIIAAVPATKAEMGDKKDIVDTAVADGRFTTLVTAVKAAGLVDTLKGDGPFTVFAPTDDAFKALPAGTLDKLLADKEALKNVLLYHVVSGKVTSDQVVKLSKAGTVLGKDVMVKAYGGKVKINDITPPTASSTLSTKCSFLPNKTSR